MNATIKNPTKKLNTAQKWLVHTLESRGLVVEIDYTKASATFTVINSSGAMMLLKSHTDTAYNFARGVELGIQIAVNDFNR